MALFSHRLLTVDSATCLLFLFGSTTVLCDPLLVAILPEVLPHLQLISVILLSHPSAEFMAGYAALVLRNPVLRTIPTYATLPVINLGRVTTLDEYRTLGLVGPVDTCEFEVEEIEELFDKILPLKHAQTTPLDADGISITPYNAGHTLGGTLWAFVVGNERVVYAPAWNHSKDLFLSLASFLQPDGLPLPQLFRPQLVVCGTRTGSALPHRQRAHRFLELVDATLQKNGTVLLPASVGLRMLELIHLVDDYLGLRPVPVLMLTRTGSRVLDYAGLMLEWMAPAVLKLWESRNQVPFDSLRVQVVEVKDLARFPGPKVLFCLDERLTRGSELAATLLRLCQDQNTTVMLTEQAAVGTVAHKLYAQWFQLAVQHAGRAEDGMAMEFLQTIELESAKEELLLGLELRDFNDRIGRKRREAAAAKSAEDKARTLLEEDEESSEGEEEEEEVGEEVPPESQPVVSQPTPSAPVPVSAVDIDVRSAKGRNRMFPFNPSRPRFDDYGAVIKHTDFKSDADRPAVRVERERGKRSSGALERRRWNEERLDELKARERKRLELDSLHDPRHVLYHSLVKAAHCVLVWVDLAGLADLRSMLLILPQLRPKKVVLLPNSAAPGSTEVSDAFNKAFGRKGIEVVLATAEGVEVGGGTTSYEVTLDDQLVENLKWQTVAGGYSIAWVVGEIGRPSRVKEAQEEGAEVKQESTEVKQEGAEVKQEDAEVKQEGTETADTSEDVEMEDAPSTLVLRQPTTAPALSSQPLAVGDIRLSELRKRLAQLDLKAEPKGEGTLVVDGKVLIRKVLDGNIVVDGVPSSLFYQVRECVRDMLGYVF